MSLELIRAELLPVRFDDNTVVDAARVSFAKRAENFTEEENRKLARFLKANVHWSPYGHQREAFSIPLTSPAWLHFLENAILAGFTWVREGYPGIALNGSLWAWMENMQWLPENVAKGIIVELYDAYPMLAPILFPKKPDVSPHPGVIRLRGDRESATVGNANIHYAQFRIASPIFTARQLVKHQVHLCWNEESRRYITDPVEYYEGELRKAASNVKQGSSDELLDNHKRWEFIVASHHKRSDALYTALLEAGCAPEQARGVLPLNSITNWVWTGSLPAWARVVRQRIDGHAQKESQRIGALIDKQLNEAYPGVWNALRANV